ncbi:hypothetical protein C0Z18_27305 [Trinickia dabaoshanensis]|uniref:Uncharacterized protein n=1 Tax=Trinickia dabaoshanensis TaxID=564714 RepID=A0A2N7VDZ2_9BURK|nr:hypothetical protein C0Z18_27305 [Trinickia dabaoshanensis]
MAESGHYRAREELLSTGVRIAQRVDAVAFAGFQGAPTNSPDTDVPAVGGDHMRSIRALVPNERNSTFAIALPNGSAYLTLDLFNHALLIGYGGPSVTQSATPFWGTDKKSIRLPSDDPRWSQVVNTGDRISSKATHVLVTLYVVPRLDDRAKTGSTANLTLTVSEATVQGMHVVSGRSLADSVMLSVSDADWAGWREQPLRAGTIAATDAAFALPAAFPHRLPFLEQRTVDLSGDSGGRRRDKRCMMNVAYEMSNLLFPALLEVYFGRSDLCTLDPHPNQDIAAPLPLVEVANREDVPRLPDSAVFEATAQEPDELGAVEAFDAAMNIEFCNSNHPQAAGEDACTDADRRAAAALGDLTPTQIDEFLAQIERMYDADRAGPATLRTGNDELDRWLNADLVRAENALNAAQAVVHVSDAREEPEEPVKKKKKKNNKKQKLVKASCTENDKAHDAPGDRARKCVKAAKALLRERSDTVAITPQVASRDSYSLRGTDQFNRFVREFRNSGRGMPRGISEDQFATFTAAIGRDTASTGDNLGFVFINDPVLRGGASRFPYGVEHIWSPGGGGNENAGHRQDWEKLKGLPVENRELLIQVIMAALTDRNARFTQTRSHNGNVVRTFQYFVFMRGNVPYAVRNVRIVLAQNGMVVTAFPLRGASAEPLAM